MDAAVRAPGLSAPGGASASGALRRTPVVLACLGLLLTLLSFVSAAPPAGAADDDAPPELPPAGSPWFGPGLTWTEDSAADYASRLGRTPSLYTQRVNYPLGDDDRTYLRQFVEQAATQGAVAVVSLEPVMPLVDLTDAHAADLADELVELHDDLDTYFLVRFAPEMNGTWYGWGQQPRSYVEAFRTVADAVHDATPHAAMVWSPVYGAGYPYGAAYGDVDPDRLAEVAELDTDGSGRLDEGDDPYGPYWPGPEAVDWVGLTLYHFGPDRGRIDNDLDPTEGGETGDVETSEGFELDRVPAEDAYRDRLEEQFNYVGDGERTPFYERFAEEFELPMLVETGALWIPDDAGDPELDIKQTWWRQVFEAEADYPLVRGYSWLEQRRPEAEADDRTVDWRATRTDELTAALRPDLLDSDTRLGPVTRVLDQEAGNEATAQGRLPDADDIGAEMGWIVFCVAVLAVLFALAGPAGRWLPSWRYPDEDDPRDKRLDLFRGWIILAVVITHIEVASPYSYITLNAIGAITGAEMFVLLSGIVLGMIYLPTVRKLGEWPTAVTMWRRARKQYVVALVVVMLVYLLGLVPFIDATVITTFTDRGTGEDGEVVTGQVYDLYANAPRLFDYPPPWYAVRQFLLLEMGPWVFNIMGLFVVLSLLLPVLMFLVKRGLWWLLLAISWGLYIWNAFDEVHPLPSQFEAVFPLPTWQIAFTHGLVLGVYRRQITRALLTRAGKIGCAVFVFGYAGSLVWLWLAHTYGYSASPFPEGAYGWLYDNAYTRVFLQPGRLLDLALMIIVAYAVLTTMWKPIDKVIGWFWTPLGSSSLYVFIVHVFFVLAVGNIPGLDRGSIWQGTLVHTAVLALIWLMVRKRFLFSVIPR
ncbi:OpgC domain-containing protein [Nocardioides sp. ChNu-99]|uniref:OpgC domain-containing protein n=1 Tax=Nocardioides sp. ChNu-99 TaxID=2839897 RepID=UPI00240763A6|nr:OpgC domain-containing protein [Nocardioides sp. ChNu-99]MDF9715397.1 OpgC domain-containing protein [Nocardioides sp. ChNu-99]